MKTIKDVFKHFKSVLFCKEIFLVINCTEASASSGVLHFTRLSELVLPTRADIEQTFSIEMFFFSPFLCLFLFLVSSRLAKTRGC